MIINELLKWIKSIIACVILAYPFIWSMFKMVPSITQLLLCSSVFFFSILLVAIQDVFIKRNNKE